MARLSMVLVAVALLPAGCHKPAATGPAAPDASVTPAAFSAAPVASAAPPMEKPKKPAPKPTFEAKASGKFDGVVWKPTFATVSVREGEATLAIWDNPNLHCNMDATDNTLQLLVMGIPYAAGKKTDLAKLKKPNPNAKTPDAFLGQVSLLNVESKNLASRYSGTVEVTSAPSEVDALAHAKVDIHADAVALEGELDAIVCMYE